MNGENQDPAQPGYRQMYSMMSSDNGIAEQLLQPCYSRPGENEATVSQADVIADLLNVMRLDIHRIGEEVGADVEIERMSSRKAAMLVQSLILRESMELVEKFNDLEDKRETVLEELLDEDELEGHRDLKQRVVKSQPDPEFEVEGSPDSDDEGGDGE